MEIEERFADLTEQIADHREWTQFGYERLDKALSALSAGLLRLERKLDRVLALTIESRRRT